jgi:predicted nucleic acid-binding Zn finger protein
MTDEIHELRRLVEVAVEARPHLTTRLEKGAFLLLLRRIDKLEGDVWRVGAEDGLRSYLITNGDCECSDYQRHGKGFSCKHLLALFFRELLEKASTSVQVTQDDA